MKPADKIERSIKKLRVRFSPEADERILSAASAELERAVQIQSEAKRAGLSLRRFVMKNHWTKVATAAVVIIAVGAGLIAIVENGGQTLYALEQTVEAHHSVRSIHLKDVGATEYSLELWIEFDQFGELLHLRAEEPRYSGYPKTGDGAKEVVYSDNKLEIWFTDRNMLIITKGEEAAAVYREEIKKIDPRLLVQRLYALQTENKVEIEIAEPSRTDDLISLTVTHLPQSPTPDERLVVLVDPETKLVAQIEYYERAEGDYEFEHRLEILEYNQPIDPALFILNVPDDVTRIDQHAQEVGLGQGDLSEEEIAEKLVREFWEALMAEDYAKVRKLMGGFPDDKLKREFGGINVLRIISIGKAEPHAEWPILVVPYKVEIERKEDGEKQVIEGKYGARRLRNQPERWVITGAN